MTSYVHVVVKPYDHALDYKKFCIDVFGDNKCLVMMEVKGGDHLHIQGEPCVSAPTFRKYQKEIGAQHYRKLLGVKCHPVKKRKLDADEKGFQYMSKELPSSVVIYKQGITDEELLVLYELSNQLREEQRAGLANYIVGAIGSSDLPPCKLHRLVKLHAQDYYREIDKNSPPNLRNLLEGICRKYFWSPAMREYLADLI